MPLRPPPADAAERRERIVNLSRERYAARRDGIAADLSATAREPTAHAPTGETAPNAPLSVPTNARRAASTPTPSPAIPVAAGEGDPVGVRGGTQHKYLQDLIKRWAETRGFRVTVEKPVLDGLGSVDVALEKNGCPSIACEICVTTPTAHELGNAEKCLAAGFDYVFLVAPDKTVLGRVRTRVAEALNANQAKRVQFVLPEQVFAAITALEARVATPSKAGEGDAGKELLTAKEVEDLVRIDVKTIYSYVQRGLIPYVRIQSNLTV